LKILLTILYRGWFDCMRTPPHCGFSLLDVNINLKMKVPVTVEGTDQMVGGGEVLYVGLDAGLADPSDHIEFDEAPPLDQPGEGQRSEIQAPVASVDDQLGDAASHGRRLLETVSAESVREEDVCERGVRPDDAVVVDDIHLIISGP